jgi:hypothetical protein
MQLDHVTSLGYAITIPKVNFRSFNLNSKQFVARDCHQSNMASIVRPTLLRQTCLAAASKRAFSTKVSTSFPAVVRKPSPSILSRQSVRSAFVRDNIGSIWVAAFHASGRQAILPAGPRMSPIAFILFEGIANSAPEVIDGTGMELGSCSHNTK